MGTDLHPSDERWAAVQRRDAAADGRFVYAVASTGIYCRPSCPSRRPGRAQVRFFPTPSAAEGAGYRACRRCRPAQAESDLVRRVRAAQDYLEAHLDERVTLAALGRAVGASPYHLQRTFKQVTGMTPRAFVGARRLDRMKSRLKEGASVTRATYEAGYSSSSRAYDQTRARLGMSPGSYGRGGRGTRIRFTIVRSALGHVLVAATDRGLCAVALDDDPARLATELRREFPAASIERRDDDLGEWAGRVVARVEGEEQGGRLPLDARGTAFQERVWAALQRIPRGTTRTYSEVARELGRPTAARAVARACASNRVAVVIPCHRVVREDGGLGGYRWGIERKRELLDGEARTGERRGA